MFDVSKKISPNKICLYIAFTLVIWSFSFTSIYAKFQNVEQGLIDLRSHDFEENTALSLSGEWFFYWNELLFPLDIDSTRQSIFRPFTKAWNDSPELSSKGFSTYRALVLMPKAYPTLALEIPDFYSSYRLFLNGVEVSRNGTPAKNKEQYVPYWLPKTIAISDFDSDTLELVLQVANFDHRKGGAYQAIKLGKSEQLFESRFLEYGYAFVLTGALLMGGLFFFGLYLFGRHETTILYFSIFCIVYSYRIIGFGSYPLHFLIQDVPWVVTLKLEYITLFLSGYLFGTYIQRNPLKN